MRNRARRGAGSTVRSAAVLAALALVVSACSSDAFDVRTHDSNEM